MSLYISNTTAFRNSVPFQTVKDEILGKNYQLSLALVGEKRARKINQQSRQKDYSPNVLSFPLSKTSGEIYITPIVAKREAKQFGHSVSKHVLYLFIHGLLHLKGYDHGPKMEKLEQKFLKKHSTRRNPQ